MSVAGSPLKCRITNTITATPATTQTAPSARRTRNAVSEAPYPLSFISSQSSSSSGRACHCSRFVDA